MFSVMTPQRASKTIHCASPITTSATMSPTMIVSRPLSLLLKRL